MMRASPNEAGAGPDQSAPPTSVVMRSAVARSTEMPTPPAAPPTSTPRARCISPAPITAAIPSFVPEIIGMPIGSPRSLAASGRNAPIRVPGKTSGGSARSSSPPASLSRSARCEGESDRAGSQNEATASPLSRKASASHVERSQAVSFAAAARSRMNQRAFGSSASSQPDRPKSAASCTSSSAARRSRQSSAALAALPSSRTGTSVGPCPSAAIPRISIAGPAAVTASPTAERIASHQTFGSCSTAPLAVLSATPLARRVSASGRPLSASTMSTLTAVLPRSIERSAPR